MCRGGRRPGAGVKTGSKRGPYGPRSAATAKRSRPTAASTALLGAWLASGTAPPQDGHGGPPAAAAPPQLEVDDKSTTRANTGADGQLAADTRGTLPRDHDMGK